MHAERLQPPDRPPLVDRPGIEQGVPRSDVIEQALVDEAMLCHQRIPATNGEPVENMGSPIPPAPAEPGDAAADRDPGAGLGLDRANPVEHGDDLAADERSVKQAGVMERVDDLTLATSVLEVEIEADAGEPFPRQMRERIAQTDVRAVTRVEDRVGEHELAAPRADVELDHVDADVRRGVE